MKPSPRKAPRVLNVVPTRVRVDGPALSSDEIQAIKARIMTMTDAEKVWAQAITEESKDVLGWSMAVSQHPTVLRAANAEAVRSLAKHHATPGRPARLIREATGVDVAGRSIASVLNTLTITQLVRVAVRAAEVA